MAQVGEFIRERGLSPDIRRMYDAIGHFVEATATGDEAAIERVLRDEWLPVAGDDPRTTGTAQLALAMIQGDRGDLEGATERLHAAVSCLGAAGDDGNLALALERLALAVEERGNRAEALGLRQDAIPVLRRLGDDRRLLRALGEVGRLLRMDGRIDDAERLAR
ncbi:MAG: hypothetical protein H0V89_06600, partial [Deltaproteobacteria bacterium]|nr:hypothetical protein [Deltaproteobacteria bacterium]